MSDDLLPKSGKLELHLTYRCDLACPSCNRASFVREPPTPDMTLDDARDLFRQARELGWQPNLVLIIGGEPTVHPDFVEFVRLSAEFNDNRVQVWSNAYSPRARQLCEQVRDAGWCSLVPETAKPGGSVLDFPNTDIFVSPADFGLTRTKCYQHQSEICGISADSRGVSPCAIGGMIDGFLDLGVRTKRLADLWDPVKVRDLTERLCRHCGHQFLVRLPKFQEHMDASQKRMGTPMSPTWVKAFEGRR